MFKNQVVNVIILIVLITAGIYFGRKVWDEYFPGDYPMVVPTVKAEFSFSENEIRVDLSGTTKSGRIIVYAYSSNSTFYGILKPINNNTLFIRKNDFADFAVPVRRGEIGNSHFLKKMDRYVKKVDMFRIIKDSSESGRNFGVQNCLYPICTKCTDGCKSVIHGGDLPIVMKVMKNGEIMPEFSRGKCPRCGKCFIWCPSGVIKRSKKPWEEQ